MLSPSFTRFWQLLLLAELPKERLNTLLSQLSESLTEEEAIQQLRNSPLLSASAKAKFERETFTALSKALSKGASVVHSLGSCPKESDHGLVSPAFFALGDHQALALPKVAIVGTRGASPYGKAAAQKFAEAFARAGIAVVSGGAMGIDAAAHTGALEAKGKTVCVLPSGIDQLYPAVNHQLFARIQENGCILSQFPCGYKMVKTSYLDRNYTIAALSSATLVVEAPERSGAIHTANRAAEMGRPVYVVPASITFPSFKGSHELIRNGATLVDHPDQILADLKIMNTISSDAPRPKLEEAQELILSVLGDLPLHPEKIAELTKLSSDQVQAELTMLELEGRIVRGGGGITRTL